MKEKDKDTIYMNESTGSVGTYDDWYYKDENGIEVNAVDLGEVIEVDNPTIEQIIESQS